MIEMQDPQPKPDQIDQEASSWIVLEGERQFTPEEEIAFSEWLTKDPRHEQVYESMRQTWEDIPALQELGELVPLSSCQEAAPLLSSPRRRGLRLSMVALASTAAAFFVLFFVQGTWGEQEQYSTQIAEMRQVSLPDGSLVTLGPKSKLTVKFGENERRVALTGGEAFFDVVPDPVKPFLVEAGPSLIRVLGTKFDVSHGAASVRVAVLEGVVQVNDTRAIEAASSSLLKARQRAEVPLEPVFVAASASIAKPEVLPAAAPGAWREGRLVYDSVRLADLVADVNRYYEPGVRITHDAAGEQRVTASFKTTEIPAFMSALSAVVPVKMQEMKDGSFRISSPGA